jgi:hypothetical protein
MFPKKVFLFLLADFVLSFAAHRLLVAGRAQWRP